MFSTALPSPQSTEYAPVADRATRLDESFVTANKPTNLLSVVAKVGRVNQSDGRTHAGVVVTLDEPKNGIILCVDISVGNCSHGR